MNLRSDGPYWLYNTPQLYTYPALHSNISTEVAIIGTGVSAALTAYALVNAGCKVLMLTKHHPGTDSTAASTALLQYEIDTPLYKLTGMHGQAAAERSYMLCHHSIDKLEKIHEHIGEKKIFERHDSVLLASLKKDVPELLLEYEARKTAGIKVDWLSSEDVQQRLGFDAPAAIISKQAATTNAYRFTQQLIKWCVDKGAEVYDNAEVIDIKHNARSVTLTTSEGVSITAKHAVMAAGYESTQWLNLNVARMHSTYAMISKPFTEGELQTKGDLIWETARPYIYMRTTPDNRIILGGKDDPFASGKKRDAMLGKKTKDLQAAFAKKYPKLTFDVDYAWAGTFAETIDGLPYIGAVKEMPRVQFALGFGGNGITFSQVAADIITDTITGKKNADAKLFSFYRKLMKPDIY